MRRVSADGFNDAMRDPAVRAIDLAADGNHRMLDTLDLAAARADPKPVLGTGGTTFVHLELWRTCRLAGWHGSTADPPYSGAIESDSAELVVPGRASGTLMGGSLAALRAMIGAGLPDLDGTILLLTDPRTQGLGQVDRQLTHLLRAGVLSGVRAVAVGRFPGFEGHVDREWTLLDVLRDRLGVLGVPVLGGLPVGPCARAVPIGTEAELDADAGTLTVAAPAVQHLT